MWNDAKIIGDARRKQALEEGSLKTGFNKKSHYEGYNTNAAKSRMPGGYRDKDEIHHILSAIEGGGPFLANLNEQEQASLIRFGNSIGIRFANDPLNLLAASMESHRGVAPSIHSMLGDMQLDTTVGMDKHEILSNGKDVGYASVNEFHERLAQLPLSERKQALEVYAEYVYDPMVSNLQGLGHKVNSRLDNIKEYEKELKAERINEHRAHVADALGVPSDVTESEASANIGKIRKALKLINDNDLL